jgi:hypothetical protein
MIELIALICFAVVVLAMIVAPDRRPVEKSVAKSAPVMTRETAGQAA